MSFRSLLYPMVLIATAFAVPAMAGTVFETASLPADDNGDYIVGDTLSLGATFTLAGNTHITSIGFGAGRYADGETIFGAIVPVDPITGFPLADFDDLAPTALGSTLITLASGPQDASGDLSLNLAAGTYGVVFGTGQFGATGFAPFVDSDTIGTPNVFDWFEFDGDAWETHTPDVRIFVDGVAVPEPWTIALMLAGLGGLAGLSRSTKSGAVV
jgi:PEP-CTERM motif